MGANIGLTTTEVGGLMKINLHETGSWQIGYTSEYEERQRKAGAWQRESRHWDIWQRPSPLSAGHVLAIKIMIPSFALHARPAPTKPRPVRWIDAREGRAVVFTLSLTKSSVPPWGYSADHDTVGTLSLPTGEFALLCAHYVDSGAATTAMLQSLGRFVQTLMLQDTSALEPLPTDETLMGLSIEPTGVRTITEIALWGLTTADAVPAGSGESEGMLHDFSTDLSEGLIDLTVPIPRSVFTELGIEPKVDNEKAQEIARNWNDAKIAEMQRLLQLGSFG